jgi:WhiB family redox-sensing transcriptional regulator
MANRRQIEYDYTALYAEIEAADDIPCRDIPEIFFPDDLPMGNLRKQATQMAKNLCSQCPIQVKCLMYAVASRQEFGIWGGTLPTER